jgi:cell fate (sporulation/competence/biofilm development) regulator YlbF (YheA/YmcA/DUF963 family)
MDINLTNIIDNFSEHLINLVPEFSDLRSAQIELNENPESEYLFSEINNIKETIVLLKSKNLPVSQEQEEEMSALMTKMREDQIIMRYLRSKNLARKKAIEIGNLLETKVGVNFAAGKICK